MKNTLHMFNALQTGQKIPFALDKFTTAEPIQLNSPEAGTIIYGVGVPSGIRVKETLAVVNETVVDYYGTLSKGGLA